MVKLPLLGCGSFHRIGKRKISLVQPMVGQPRFWQLTHHLPSFVSTEISLLWGPTLWFVYLRFLFFFFFKYQILPALFPSIIGSLSFPLGYAFQKDDPSLLVLSCYKQPP